MNKPKRQHYVSEMQQRHFTDDEGKLYFFRKSQREKGVLREPQAPARTSDFQRHQAK